MKIHPLDTVEVRADGHKYALREISRGEPIIKYGMPIGHALCDIPTGAHVHTHNAATNLSGKLEYRYAPSFTPVSTHCTAHFMGYARRDGQFGIRNDIWVIPTVGCVNSLAKKLAQSARGIALTHPYGCSQLGDDHENTADILASLAHSPNAGGVLVVGLGCENNTLASFKKRLGDVSELNIRFMLAQEVDDEFETGLQLISELERGRVTTRTPVPVSELRIGLKCGGSDGFSGLTANPLVGRFSDWLIAQGGTSVLTEVPEMFGAETLLMDRCADRQVFEKCVAMINGFKDYYTRHGQVIYDNPSPGNKDGGITTLEDKSLGCVQKGGASPVMDVLEYAQRLSSHGLNLLAAPGNDLVASTALAAAGCHAILFTTGRGTPYGTVVPTIKIASNTPLAIKKRNWIDWDAQANPDTAAFTDFILNVVSGNLEARNETTDNREIAIFKDGVTL